MAVPFKQSREEPKLTQSSQPMSASQAETLAQMNVGSHAEALARLEAMAVEQNALTQESSMVASTEVMSQTQPYEAPSQTQPFVYTEDESL